MKEGLIEISSAIRRLVLKRDGWRCQVCGRLSGLQVHHITFRSHQGPTTEDNLITLCFSCHSHVHEGE